jgi:hypothetical protein
MSARRVVPGLLVPLAALLLLVLAAAPVRAWDGSVSVRTNLNCGAGYVDITITNETAAAATVWITIGQREGGMGDGEPNAHPPIEVPPGGTVTDRVQPLPSIELYSYAQLNFWLGQPPGGAPLGSVVVLPCPIQIDLRAVARSGVPVEIEMGCSPALPSTPRHGTVRMPPRSTTSVIYTAARGYVGPDQFGYTCPGAAAQSGTVFITVRPGLARPAPPSRPVPQPSAPPARTRPRPVTPHPAAEPSPAAEPGLAATGAAVGRAVGVGVGLLTAGTVTLLVGTRRRGRAIH